MGIAVADLSLDSTGVLLANAYLAISKNTVYLHPQQGGENTVYTSYNVWNSFADREAGRQPIEARPLQVSTTTFDGLYDLLYIALRNKYPGSVDVIDQVIDQAPAPSGMMMMTQDSPNLSLLSS